MKIKPMKHQAVSIKFAGTAERMYDMSDPGCVSADTEFLTIGGWKRIDQYTKGDMVGQFYPDTREVELVLPTQYIKRPCKEMISIAPVRGMSQRLSPEHRVLYYTPTGEHAVCSAAEFMEHLHVKGANHAHRKFCSTFSARNNTQINLGENELRLMVAVIADGHFPGEGLRCTIRLKKLRKIERLRSLLATASVNYKERTCGGTPDFQVFTFNAPVNEKVFGPLWWEASQSQLVVIADELPHWDGAISPRDSKGMRFSSFRKESAEFAQYAFAAAKRPTSLKSAYRDRTAEGRGHMTEYVVHAMHEDAFIGPGRADSVQVISNPEGFKYCFEVPTSFLLLRHNGYVFATGNTGKTFVQIMAFAKRQKRGQAMLVIAPKSLLEPAWGNDITKFTPELTYSIANADNRAAAFEVEADIYITNTDAAVWLAKQPKAFFKRFIMLVVDELTNFKHPTSQRSKAMNKIKGHFRYRSGLSGTPNPNTITDIWHQMYILDDGKRLGSSFFAFRNATCTPKQVGSRREMVKWEDKDGAEEVTFALLSDVTIRHKFEDCIDIPENLQYTVSYKLPAKQLRTYKEMALTQIAALGKGQAVTAINAAAVTTKLLQIASGAVYEHTGKYHLVDTGRYELVLDLVEERKHSLVFFLWQHQRDYLVAEAVKRKLKFCLFDGSASEATRSQMIRDYQAGFYQVMFAHPQSAAHGLTLTRGTATIWPSPTYNLEHFVQGNKRTYRNGQKNKTETIVIIAPDTLEEKVYEKLQAKNLRMSNLLDLFT